MNEIKPVLQAIVQTFVHKDNELQSRLQKKAIDYTKENATKQTIDHSLDCIIILPKNKIIIQPMKYGKQRSRLKCGLVFCSIFWTIN